jgi:YidC/Oxa1 family membrane protein insertase
MFHLGTKLSKSRHHPTQDSGISFVITKSPFISGKNYRLASVSLAVATALFCFSASAQNEAPPAPIPPVVDSIVVNPQVELDREDLLMRFTQSGACIEDIQLKGFKENSKDSENAHVTGGHFPCRALGIKIGAQDLRTNTAQASSSGAGSVSLIQNFENLEITRSIKLTQPYSSEFSLSIKNNGTTAWSGPVSVDLGGVSELKGAGDIFGGHPLEYREATYQYEDEVKRETLPFDDAPTLETILEKKNFRPDWVAANSLYFALILLPKSPDVFDFSVIRTGFNSAENKTTPPSRTLYDVLLTTQVNDLQPGASKTLSFDMYSGPKSKSALASFSGKNLQKNIDYGFFAVIAWPLYYFLKWCEGLLGNWGLAIIILTVVLKIILYPLTEKAFVAGKKMQKIQPELNALKEKYKDDKQAQQKEMMAIMGQRGVNPMSGCLPILPQLPIFFGLNAVLLHTFELRHAHFAGWLNDLTARDPLYITPALMAVLMYVQQKMTPAPASMDPAQQKMMQWLPVIFAVFMLTYPSGLVLYIITNTVLSLLQQQYMMKKYKDA